MKSKYPNLDIDIVDSRSASVGFGLLVYKAARMAREGKSKEEILKMLDFYVTHVEDVYKRQVVLSGINLGEIESLAALTVEHPWDVRFIEFMPFWGNGGVYGQEHVVPIDEIRRRVLALLSLIHI